MQDVLDLRRMHFVCQICQITSKGTSTYAKPAPNTATKPILREFGNCNFIT